MEAKQEDSADAESYDVESNPSGEHRGVNFVHEDFMPREAFLQHLDQQRLDPDGIDKAWDSVVHVSVRVPGGTTTKSGTGWVITKPPLNLMVEDEYGGYTSHPAQHENRLVVVTNRHVVPTDDLAPHTTITFFYEENNEHIRVRATRVLYFSPETLNKAPLATREMGDFAVLEFALPAGPKEHRERIARVEPLFAEESRVVSNGDFIALVGHPRGGYKRGSLGKATSDQGDKAYLRYDAGTSRPGNSGSPVFGFGLGLAGIWPSALHYRSGLGSTLRGGVMDTIREQYAAQLDREHRFETRKKMLAWAEANGCQLRNFGF